MNSKSLIIVITVGLLAVSAALLFRGGSGKSQAAPPAYVNPEIAAAYQTFNQTLAVNEPEALAALDIADKASPDNAFHDYLRAVAAVKNKNYTEAIAQLKAGNASSKLVVYTEAAMPSTMDSLPSMRRLNPSASDLKDLKQEEGMAYLTEARTAGYRLADLDPIDSLAAVHVVSFIKNIEASFLEFSKIHKLKELEAESTKRVKQLDTWEAEFKKAVAPENAILRVAELAGVDSKIVSDYMAKVEIKDAAVLKKIEDANAKMYAEEVAAVKASLAKLPGRPQPKS